MNKQSKINALRIEKKLSLRRLEALEKNLNTGTFNTRKFQQDSEKIQRIKNRLNEISTEISTETEKLSKLKNIQIDTTADIPILQKMFRTPPPHIGADQPQDSLNTTFEAKTTETQPPKSVDTTGIFKETVQKSEIPDPHKYFHIEDITETDPKQTKQNPQKSEDLDFQNFMKACLQTGTIPKAKRNLDLPVTSEQLTTLLSDPTLSKTSNLPKVTQTFKAPITVEIPQKPISLADDSYALRPPVPQKSFKESNLDYPIFHKEPVKPKLPQFQTNIIDYSSESNQPKMAQLKSQNLSQFNQFPQYDYNSQQTRNFGYTKPQNIPTNLLESQQEVKFENTMENTPRANFAQQNDPQPLVNLTQQNDQFQQQYVQNPNNYRHYQQNAGFQNQDNYRPNQPDVRPLNQQLNLPNPQGQYDQNQRIKPRDTFLRRLRCIPKFNGENYSQLKEFIDVVESLYVSCSNQNEENELYEQILLQVRGEARNLIMSLNNPDWLAIKNKLLKDFAYLANKEILTTQLENAR